MTKVFIVAAKRTAVGSFLGALKNTHPSDMGAAVVAQLIKDTGVNPAAISEVICGNIYSAGIKQGIGRQISVKAGIPVEVPASNINMLCGSGMKAVMNGYAAIRAGLGELVVAGGVESMSGIPYLLPRNVRLGIKMGQFTVLDSMMHDGLNDAFSGVHMGVTAENIAKMYGITRQMQDEFALKSQQKAIAAQDAGLFKDEIVPLLVKDGKTEFVFDADEPVNRATDAEKLAKLNPAFVTDGTGTVTAGNASGCNDGASFVMLASEAAVKKHGLKPLMEIIGVGQGGVDPQLMGMGPVPAIKNALANAGKKFEDMQLIELNEAFAAQSLGVLKQLAADYSATEEEILQRTNLLGGAIALGHAVGSSGCRILVTLIHQMLKGKAEIGLASLCIGGGMGAATILRKC